MPFTKRAVDIFAPTDAGGAQRSVLNGEVQVWGTEVEHSVTSLATFVVNSSQSGETLDLSGYNQVIVNRWTDASLFAPAWYQRVETEPGHPGKWQDSRGNWFEIAESTLTPQMFGAVPIPFNAAGFLSPPDSTAALARWAAVVEATRRPARLDGFYSSTSSIEIASSSIQIRDRGWASSGFLFHGCDGLKLSQDQRYVTLDLYGFAILTTDETPTYTAFDYTNSYSWPGDAADKSGKFLCAMGLDKFLNRAFDYGAGPFNDTWKIGYDLDEADRLTMFACSTEAAASAAPAFASDTIGYHITDSTTCILFECHGRFFKEGVLVDGFSEGSGTRGGSFVANHVGFRMGGTSNHGIIDDTHFSSFAMNVDIGTGLASEIIGGFWLKRPDSNVPGFIHLRDNGQLTTATGQKFYHGGALDPVASSDIAIDAGPDARSPVYADQVFFNQATILRVDGAVTNSVVLANPNVSDLTTPSQQTPPISGAGAGAAVVSGYAPRTAARRFGGVGSSLVLTRNTGATVGNGTNVDLSWSSRVQDDFAYAAGSSWWQSGDNTKITIGLTGRYRVRARIAWANNATGRRQVLVRINGGAQTTALGSDNREASTGGDTFNFIETAPLSLTSGDVIELRAFQNSGGDLNVLAGSWFEIERI